MASGAFPIHVFWREDSADTRFTYSGIAQILEVEPRTPVQFRFGFSLSPVAQELRLKDLADQDQRQPMQSTVVAAKQLKMPPALSTTLTPNSDDQQVRRALSRLAQGIQDRIQNSGVERTGHHPQRVGPNLSEIFVSLNRMWNEQKGHCHLCSRAIPLNSTNMLLQLSADRIDSEWKSYEAPNVHITHLGCNLAKNNASMDEWHEYLTMLRNGPGISEDR